MLSKHCLDCGEPLDQWGICPFADPARARVEREPVSCGRTKSENAARLAQTLAAAGLHPADQVLHPVRAREAGVR